MFLFLFGVSTAKQPTLTQSEYNSLEERLFSESRGRCSAYTHKELEFSEDEIYYGHEKLRNFLSWVRIPEDNVDVFDHTNYKVFSMFGYQLIYFPFIIVATSMSCILVIILFYYCPIQMSSMFSMIQGGRLDDSQTVLSKIESFDYYKFAKNSVNRLNVMYVYFGRFLLAVMILVSLGFAILTFFKYNSKAKCGYTQAAMSVLNGYDKGGFFGQFSVYGEKSVLIDFAHDLRGFQPGGIDYNQIIKEKIAMTVNDIHQKIGVFFDKAAFKQIPSPSNNHLQETAVISHEIAKLFDVNQNNSVNDILDRALYLSGGAEILQALSHNETREEFMGHFEESITSLHSKVEEINKTVLEGYWEISTFFANYYKYMKFLGLVCVIIFVYSLSLLLPIKQMNIFSRPIQMILLCICAILLAVLSSYLFVKSQLLIKSCIASYKWISYPQAVKGTFGDTDQLWMDTCVANGANGNVEGVMDLASRNTLERGLILLRGFGSNYKVWEETINHELWEIKQHGFNIKNFQTYKKDNLNNTDGYFKVRDRINLMIACTKNRVELSEEDCKGRTFFKDFVKGDENRTDAICFVPTDIPVSSLERYTGTCAINPVAAGAMLDSLKFSMNEHTKYMDELSDYYELVSKRFSELVKSMKRSKLVYEEVRSSFNNSILRLAEQGGEINKILKCGELRTIARSALGNTCYDESFTYGSTWMAIFCIVAAYLTASLVGFVFVENLLDKQVVQKYIEGNRNGLFGVEMTSMQ